MANNWFQFQQFKVNQVDCAMKITTDAVLLGALASHAAPHAILDIGTGTGVIALMLAQRFPSSKIDAVEIDTQASVQAKSNFLESPFSEQLTLWNGRIQDYPASTKYELIVSNPPYFPDHLKSENAQRNTALHTDMLSFTDLIDKVSQILKEDGQFWIILPQRQMNEFQQLAKKSNLFQSHKFTLQDKPGKRVLREICAYTSTEVPIEKREIFVKNADETPHESYANLVRGFLLAF